MGKINIKNGDKSGGLTVISINNGYHELPSGKKIRKILCKCNYCGNKKIYLINNFNRGVRSCGCLNRKKIPTGERYGRLTILKEVPQSKGYKRRFLCKCDCGNKTVVQLGNLVSNHTASCGCYAKEKTTKRMRTHGMTGTREHQIWCNIIQRCGDKKTQHYKDYGGRGIKVCKRWMKFENFYKDMGKRPSPKHSIDRIDNNGDYEPSNCRWATQEEQMNNTRKNRRITYNGETKTIAQWARKIGVEYDTLWQRLVKMKWTVDRAFNEDPNKYHNK